MKQFIRTAIKEISLAGAAYCSTFAVPYAFKIAEPGQAFTNSVLSVFIFAGIWVLLRHAYRLLNRRMAVVSTIFGLLFSGMLIIGRNVFLFGSSRLATFSTYIKILFLVPLMAAAVACFLYYADKYVRRMEKSPLEQGTEKVLSRIKGKSWIVWGLLLLSWIPALLAAFPGLYAYDAIFQVNYVLKGGLSVHHPVLHTLWLGGSIKIGQLLFNSNEIGLLIYTITQMLAFAGTITYILRWLYRRGSVFLTLCTGFLFIALPYNALFAISATKDVMYASLFVIVVLRTYDIVTRPDEFFGHIRAQITYVLWLLGLFAMRHNGFYVFLCTVPFFIVLCRKYWKQTVAVSAAAIAVWMLFTGPGYKLLNVLDDDISLRESMCIPAQQLARSARDNADELSAEELALIESYFPKYRNYNPRIADDVKNTTNVQKIEEDPLAFIELWLKVGAKCPVTYADAWLAVSLGNWYPDQDYPLPRAFHPYMPFDNYTSQDGYGTDYAWVERTSYLPLAEKFYRSIADKTIQEKYPVISMLFSPGMAFWVLLLTIATCIYRKKTKMLLPLSLVAVHCINVLLGPVVIMRYSYPLILCVPVLLLICAGEKTPPAEEDPSSPSGAPCV